MFLTLFHSSENNKAKNMLELNEGTRFSLSIRVLKYKNIKI
jgi:hypothetical protein